jgi:hypothetical protein
MNKVKISYLLIIILTITSCKKYLDAKPDAKLATPSQLNDLQALLDNYNQMNTQFAGGTGIFSDNYYLSDDDWASIYSEDQRDYYIWQKDDNNIADWQAPYSNIYTANLVLETLKSIPFAPDEKTLSENIKGAALFFRGSYFYSIAQLFAKGYNAATAEKDLGIPLRLSTDFTKKSVRATLKETYNQIISDLKESVQLLPPTSSIKSRPSKAAAYGSLARTYLSMKDYVNADAYADSCLSLYNTLMDYNSLDSNSQNPIQRFNPEVIFQAVSLSVDPLQPSICKIDSNLYTSYSENDLRKVIYFSANGDGSYSFKGDYDGGSDNYGHLFTGIVTDEQYLIKAECEAWLDNTENSLKYLNALLGKRYRNEGFIPVTASDSVELLTIILNERRKELLFRGTRLTDLKRLNQDSRFAVTLKRKLNGTLYELSPNDNRYIAQLPKIVTDFGVKQNP